MKDLRAHWVFTIGILINTGFNLKKQTVIQWSLPWGGHYWAVVRLWPVQDIPSPRPFPCRVLPTRPSQRGLPSRPCSSQRPPVRPSPPDNMDTLP